MEKFIQAAPQKGYEKEIRWAFDNFGSCMSQADFVDEWMKELKGRGLRIFYLSNWSDFLRDSNPAARDFIKYCEGGIYSCDEHMTKPSPEIYELLLRRYSLKAEECLFIDDLQANTEAAKKCGINAIVFEGYENTKKKLDEELLG